MQCLAACSQDCNCFMVIIEKSICNMYNQQAKNYLFINIQNRENTFMKKYIQNSIFNLKEQ